MLLRVSQSWVWKALCVQFFKFWINIIDRYIISIPHFVPNHKGNIFSLSTFFIHYNVIDVQNSLLYCLYFELISVPSTLVVIQDCYFVFFFNYLNYKKRLQGRWLSENNFNINAIKMDNSTQEYRKMTPSNKSP